MNKETLEILAAIEHQRWAEWQAYCHGKLLSDPEFKVGIQGLIAMERWERQIKTPYHDLSEAEKQSDRDQVMRYWPVIEEFINNKKGNG